MIVNTFEVIPTERLEVILGHRSWCFDLRYLLGRPPWDTEVTPPEVVELVEGRSLSPGRALDLGCGTGTNLVPGRPGTGCRGSAPDPGDPNSMLLN